MACISRSTAIPDAKAALSPIVALAFRTSGDVLRKWLPAALSGVAALGLSLYLALRNYQVDIDVYRTGG